MTQLCTSCQSAKRGFARAALAIYPRNGTGAPFPIDSGAELFPRDFDLIFWPDEAEPAPIFNYNLLTAKANTEGWTHLVQWQEDGRWTGIFLADDQYLCDDEYETPAVAD